MIELPFIGHWKSGGENGLETKISRTFLDFLHLGHEFFVISGHGT